MTYFYVFSGASDKVIFNILCRCPNIFSIKIRFQPLKLEYWKTEALSYPPNFLHNTSQLGDLVFHRISGKVSSYIKENWSYFYQLKKLYCLEQPHTCPVRIVTGILPINLILWTVTVKGMHLPIIFEGYGDLRKKTNKHVCDYQGFAKSSQLCQLK